MAGACKGILIELIAALETDIVLFKIFVCYNSDYKGQERAHVC